MVEILKNQGKNNVKDLAYERFEGHPVTFGDGEKVFTKTEDVFSAQRLDYILQIEKRSSIHKIKPKVDSCQVEKFNVNHALFSHLSDHYGLSIELHIENWLYLWLAISLAFDFFVRYEWIEPKNIVLMLLEFDWLRTDVLIFCSFLFPLFSVIWCLLNVVEIDCWTVSK